MSPDLTHQRTSASLIVGLALVCVVAGGAAVWLWQQVGFELGEGQAECPVAVTEADSLPQFVPREELLPEGSVGQERADVVEGLAGLGPIGQVVAGRFYEQEREVPVLVPYGERLMLVDAVRGEPAELSAVTLDEETPATQWSTRLAPTEQDWTTFTGGPVGPEWVSVFSGADPTLLSLDEAGEELACLRLPVAHGDVDVTAVTDQAGEEVVVLASVGTGGSWLARLDPTDGSQLAARDLTGPETWQGVEVVGDLVVGSRWLPATIGTSGAPRPGDAQSSWIAAWDTDGRPRWTYPAQGDPPVACVVLDVGDDATTYAVTFDRGGPYLDAVSAEGDRVWRADLEDGEWSGELWDDVLVVRGPDPRGGTRLRAFDAASGEPRWTVRARQAPPQGDDPRSDFGSAVSEESAWWVPAPNGLIRIDRESGEVTREDSEVRIDQLMQIGDSIIVRSGEAVLITRS